MKRNYPVTYLTDLSPREARKLIAVLKIPGNSAMPARYIVGTIVAAVLLGLGLAAILI